MMVWNMAGLKVLTKVVELVDGSASHAAAAMVSKMVALMDV